MLIAAQLVAGLAAVLHVVFFVFESLLWTRPAVYARFGIASREQAETIRPMAYNQGFYNLALAVGVFVGIVMLGREGSAGVVGKTLVVFGLACMVVAGVVLATTGRRYWTAAAIQFVPAALALALTVAA
jgi:putative membrane protein